MAERERERADKFGERAEKFGERERTNSERERTNSERERQRDRQTKSSSSLLSDDAVISDVVSSTVSTSPPSSVVTTPPCPLLVGSASPAKYISENDHDVVKNIANQDSSVLLRPCGGSTMPLLPCLFSLVVVGKLPTEVDMQTGSNNIVSIL